MSTFPGGTSLSFLDVYDDAAPDGVVGGSPHLHLASAECYAVVGGEGELHTVTPDGCREIPLHPGAVVWFTPGTVHRAVNHGGLRVVVLMGNAGLPEAGDAVMTFPADVVADPDRYRAAATLPPRATEAERAADARTRRDLAVEGFLPLRDAVRAGDPEPLLAFHAAAAALVRERAGGWGAIVRGGPLDQAEATLALVGDVARGVAPHLRRAAVHEARRPERVFGMCGRLSPVDVSAAPAAPPAAPAARPGPPDEERLS
ncbi:cupin domain-containing protein [Saccharothrix longispora]|uniref:cupin domain-containing protein n=1 Tax=Saccharothrix longispora TaxID=33920 RepID=UPI0028FD9E36|nr:cupin domain-containing protein [Saccharothrix longispora]MBY8848684.1 cupin domain-containing protein [Saccharothrix sp. MB29]MDU0291776.1 cupin domain-containing protein [Saccharothrix longispora]